MKYILTFVPVAALLYGAATFLYMDPNPENWGVFDRACIMIVAIAGTIWVRDAREKKSAKEDDARYPVED